MTPFDLRQGLLNGGYVPLPAKGKAIFLKNWTNLKVDEAEVERWSRETPWLPSTGIRCDGLCAIDIDVTDEALIQEVYRLARDKLGSTPLARVGRAPKLMLVYRAARGAGKKKIGTGRFLDASGDAHAVEVLRGKGCQFIAFGIHPDTQKQYMWSGQGPLAVPKKDLPGLTDATVLDFLDAVRAVFKERGLQHEDRGRSDGSEDFPRVFDLDDKTEVEVLGDELGGTWTVRELERVLSAREGETLRCTLAGFREGADGDNGSVGLCGDGFLRVTDYVERVVHLRPTLDRTEFDEDVRASIIGEAQAAYDELVQSWVYVAADDRAFDMYEPTGEGYTKGSLKTLFRQVTFEEEEVTAKWLRAKDAQRVHARLFSPRHAGERIFRDGRRRYLNTYVPPSWLKLDPDPAGLRIWEDFIGHLLPAKRERDLFLDWLANKVQRPWERMFGVMMVADGIFGTGRGSLTAIMGDLIGRDYSIEVPFDIFTGASHQAQYYDWLSGSLLVCVGEALEDRASYEGRRKAFERIKDIIDPGNGTNKYLPRKQIKAVVGDVYASVFLATNHRDSIALAENDRRLLVLSNGSAMSDAMRRALHGPAGLRATPEQLAAVGQSLLERKVTTDLFASPEMTEAKRQMIAANISDLDETFDMFLAQVQPRAFHAAQFLRFCSILAATHDVELPDQEDLRRVLQGRFLQRKGCQGDSSWPRVRVLVNGMSKQVRGVVAPGHTAGTSDWFRDAFDDVDANLETFTQAQEVEG